MAHSAINHIVILGGGTAGWMAAAACARFFAEQAVNITVVESSRLGTVGVGEATVPSIRQFNRFLGIDETEFVRETGGSYKLGIEFNDWHSPGSRYFHGFGDFGADYRGVAPHHYWLRLREQGEPGALLDYSFPAQAARQQRFAPPPPAKSLAAIAAFDYAYHFDASRYAQLLKAYALERKVRHIEGEVVDVRRQPDSGDIQSLVLRQGQTVAGDFFIDCSGFNSRLLHQTLEVGYTDWRRWLPCDRALAVGSERRGALAPYTRAVAQQAGWQWRIPLQHRMGNGSVFASEFTDEEQAQTQLLNDLEGAPLGEVRTLKFTTGHREVFWKNNCVALGLAAGFLEPLESTSIQLIQTGLLRLLEAFPRRGIQAASVEQYNRTTANEYARLRDFLIAHYCTNARDDGEFWHYLRTMALPDTLAHKLAVFNASGRVPMLADESYSEASWVAILIGQQRIPSDYARAADFPPLEDIVQMMAKRRRAIAAVVEKMPSHQRFVDETCAAMPNLT